MSIVETSAACRRGRRSGSREFACATPETFLARPSARRLTSRVSARRSAAYDSASRATSPGAAWSYVRDARPGFGAGPTRENAHSAGTGSPRAVPPTARREFRETSTRHDRARRRARHAVARSERGPCSRKSSRRLRATRKTLSGERAPVEAEPSWNAIAFGTKVALVAGTRQPQREVDVLQVREERRLGAAESSNVLGAQQTASARSAEYRASTGAHRPTRRCLHRSRPARRSRRRSGHGSSRGRDATRSASPGRASRPRVRRRRRRRAAPRRSRGSTVRSGLTSRIHGASERAMPCAAATPYPALSGFRTDDVVRLERAGRRRRRRSTRCRRRRPGATRPHRRRTREASRRTLRASIPAFHATTTALMRGVGHAGLAAARRTG